jgi:hypothetical protein
MSPRHRTRSLVLPDLAQNGSFRLARPQVTLPQFCRAAAQHALHGDADTSDLLLSLFPFLFPFPS